MLNEINDREAMPLPVKSNTPLCHFDNIIYYQALFAPDIIKLR